MPIDPPQPPTAQLGWEPALAYQPILAAPDFEPGHVAGGEQVRPGVCNWPHTVYAPEVDAFIACLYDTQVVAGADWNTWLEEGGLQFHEDPEQLATANLEQCRMLLIAHVRNDRFVDGHLLETLRSGHLAQLLQRIRELVDTRT